MARRGAAPKSRPRDAPAGDALSAVLEQGAGDGIDPRVRVWLKKLLGTSAERKKQKRSRK
jgi:hypothetical protein